MLPLTVSNAKSSANSVAPILAEMEPFTVVALARPVVVMSMLPFTVTAQRSLSRSTALTDPLMVLATSRTPLGTRTMNFTFTSLLRTFMRPPSPGSQAFWRLPELGYTEQIVTPPECSTASILTELTSPRSLVLTASTSTRRPSDRVASIDPLIPLISMVCPTRRALSHLNSDRCATSVCAEPNQIRGIPNCSPNCPHSTQAARKTPTPVATRKGQSFIFDTLQWLT